MSCVTRASAAVFSLVFFVGLQCPALAQRADLQNPNVQITYEKAGPSSAEPDTAKLEAAQKWLQDRQFLERFAQFISPIKFDHPLAVKAKTCNLVNAYYDYESSITFCYEILSYFQDVAAKYGNGAAEATPVDITSDDILVGGMAFTMLHETGHAVFDLFKMPLFGRNEDGADQVAAYVALQLSPELASKMIRGGAVMLDHLGSDPKSFADYVDSHGSPSQRFANILCLAYGHDRSAYAFVAESKLVPTRRLENCEAEYDQVKNAFAKTLSPHLDKSKAEVVRAKKDWLTKDFK